MTEPIEPEVVDAQDSSGTLSRETAAAGRQFLRGAGNLLLVRGILVLLAGLLMFYNPQTTLIYTILFFGIYVLSEGIFNLIRSSRSMPDGTQPFGCTGIFQTVLGLAMISAPWKFGAMAVLLLGLWLLVSGLGNVLGAGARTGGTMISGVLSILAGVFFLATPWVGVATLGLVIAIPFLLAGGAMIFGAVSLHRLNR